MIDIFKILKDKNSINGIDINDLMDVLVNKNTTIYDIAMVGKGKIILKNKDENKFEKLDCVCSYFDMNELTDCADILNKLAQESENDNFHKGCNCKDCFEHCLKRLEAGTLSLK